MTVLSAFPGAGVCAIVRPMNKSGEDCPLELTEQEMLELVNGAMDRIVSHLRTLPEQPAANTEGAGALARSLVEPLPLQGTDYGALLDLLFDRAIPGSFNTAGPGYLAYIPGGGLFHSAVADLISNAVNRYVGVWAAAPGLAQLEENVVRWFIEIVGYPEESAGFLSSGGSLANLSAVIAARMERLGEDVLNGTVYVSDQAHHSIHKAASLAGIPAAQVREIPSDGSFRISIRALQAQVERDRRKGFQPFLLVASAGTTNTGAVDDLAGLAEVSRSEKLWLHVDAAYGGFFLLTAKGNRAMKGIDRADSVTLDPHKSLFLPYGTGCLLVRDGETLRRTYSLHASYMPEMQTERGFVDFCEISPELSRDFRGLRVWLPLKLHGIEPFRQALEEKLALACRASEELKMIPGIEVVAEPQLSILAFRYNPGGLHRGMLNSMNRHLLDEVNRRRRVFLKGTLLRGDFVVRICVLSFRTHLERLWLGLDDIREAVRELREWVPG